MLAIILPLVALGGYFVDIARLIGQIVLSIVLILAIVGTGLFGYICIRAQARKWGAGLFVVAALCVLAIYYVWIGHLPFL